MSKIFSHKWTVMFWLWLIASKLMGQITHDSLMPYQLPEFDATDFSPRTFDAGINSTLIDDSYLQQNPSSTISEILQNNTPLYLRTYSNGMLSGISIRGFGAERTNISWNGISINNAGLGSIDLNVLSGGLFNQMHLTIGSSSTQFGNASQGGSLLLSNRPVYSNGFDIKLHQEFGSFNTWNSFAQLSFSNKRFSSKTSFVRNSSSNNFAYKDKTTAGFPTRLTENAEFFGYHVLQDFHFELPKNWSVSVNGWFSWVDRKIPPVMGAAHNNAHQWDKNVRVNSTVVKQFEKVNLKFQLAYLYDDIVYATDAFVDSALIHTAQFRTDVVWSVHKKVQLLMGGNLVYYHSSYENYNGLVHDFRSNVFILANYYINRNIKLTAGAREQFSSFYASLPSGHIGLDHFLINQKHKVGYKIGVNSAYRMPTLNDLYWVPGGNKTLKPEYSWNIEHSWFAELKAGATHHSLKVTGFFGQTSNWIQWVPTSFGYWAPENVKQVQSAGLEASYGLDVKIKKWKVHVGTEYQFIHATDITTPSNPNQLIYVPVHSLLGTVKIEWKSIYLWAYPKLYSERFTLTDNSQSIPPIFFMNVQAGYTLKLKPCSVGLFGRLNNVTNSEYQMIRNRPMPGINFIIGINFHLNTNTIKSIKHESN